MPMQPSPIAETSGPSRPSRRLPTWNMSILLLLESIHHRMLRRSASTDAIAALHEEKQRKHGESDDHHQLEIVEIRDEQGLLVDHHVDVGESRRPRDRDDRLQDL